VTVSGAAAGHGWLAAINPLARLVAVLPAVVLVFLSEESAVSIGCSSRSEECSRCATSFSDSS
jgi:hypothetical protein